MTPRFSVRTVSILSAVALAAALVTTSLLVGHQNSYAAGPPRPATAPNPRGVDVVAGLHDTAINDCDDGGMLTAAPNPDQLAAATSSLSNPNWPTGVRTVRVTLPWSIADPGAVDWTDANGVPYANGNHDNDKAALSATRTCFDTWLAAVFARGLQPEIDFRADDLYAWNGTTLMPTLAQYQDAVFQFRNQYVDCGASCPDGGQVTVIAPWNEPDNYSIVFPDHQTHLNGSSCPTNPTADNCGAVMAAQAWAVTYELVVQGGVNGAGCPNCLIVAGDFSAADGLKTITGGACPNSCVYAYLYNEYLKNTTTGEQFHPDKWAVHPYTDITDFQNGAQNPTKLSQFAAKLQSFGYGPSTYIWLNEVSVYADAGYVNDQNAAMGYLINNLPLTVAADGPQVGRIDYYCFKNGNKCSPDYALVVNGTPVPADQTFNAWADS